MFSATVLPVTVMALEIEQIAQLAHQRAQAARIEEILHQERARRPHVRDHRHRARDAVEIGERNLHARALRHRDHMDDGVGRAAHRHVHLDGVLERGLVEHAARW